MVDRRNIHGARKCSPAAFADRVVLEPWILRMDDIVVIVVVWGGHTKAGGKGGCLVKI